MRRRDFITGIVGLAAWPRAARAQKSKPTARIGVIMGIGENDPEAGPRVEALEAGGASLAGSRVAICGSNIAGPQATRIARNVLRKKSSNSSLT
jgi:hypothetical protein